MVSTTATEEGEPTTVVYEKTAEPLKFRPCPADTKDMTDITIPTSLLPDPSKLEMLADWLDLYDKKEATRTGQEQGSTTQADLRKWASALREYGVDGSYQRMN